MDRFDLPSFLMGKAAGGGGGSGGGVLVVNLDTQTRALDKTWQEITSALSSGLYPVLIWPATDETHIATLAGYAEFEEYGEYEVYFTDQMNVVNYMFMTDSPDGYPVIEQEGG